MLVCGDIYRPPNDETPIPLVVGRFPFPVGVMPATRTPSMDLSVMRCHEISCQEENNMLALPGMLQSDTGEDRGECPARIEIIEQGVG